MSFQGSQEKVFLGGEADAWFNRNKHVLVPEKADDPVIRVLTLAGLSPSTVLEVGCSNGYRLEAVRRLTGCRATGVEPSTAAIADARARFPDIELINGTLESLPIERGRRFDLVICNFVLHWVSRSALMTSLAEIDRTVADGGCLIVGDFLPDAPLRVPYHHLPGQGVFTFKQDYTNAFTATGLYREVVRLVCNHATHNVSVDVAPNDRSFVVLLRRQEQDYYRAVDRP